MNLREHDPVAVLHACLAHIEQPKQLSYLLKSNLLKSPLNYDKRSPGSLEEMKCNKTQYPFV